MRVLEVCPYDIDRPGGVQRHILDLASALGRAGHEVVLLAPGRAGKPEWEQAAGYRILRLGRFHLQRFHGTAFEVARASAEELDQLEALQRATPFDVVHFHTLWTPWLPWQVYRRLAGLVRHRVATFHDTPPPTLSGQLTRLLFRGLSRYLSRHLDAAIAVSASPAGHLWLAPGCRFYCLPPCINLAPLLELPLPDRTDQPPTILFLGRLEPRKGVLPMIEAFARVRRNHPDARLLICGAGEQDAAARALADQLGVAAAIRFTGAVEETVKLRLYAQADVFCAPSPYGESYGLVLAEAMAAGLPVVAAANSGYRTVLVGPGAEGLVTPGDEAELAQRLDRFLAREELRRELSDWGRRQARVSDVGARLDDFLTAFGQEHACRAG